MTPKPICWCRNCWHDYAEIVKADNSMSFAEKLGATSRFIVCPDCGNKRCPRATDHDLACTGSNEPGQKGSAWEAHDTSRTITSCT